MASKVNPEQLLAEINARIDKGSVGTYREGAIGQGKIELNKLEEMVRNGELAPADYATIGKQIQAKLQPIGNQSMSGSAPATAINNAGWRDIQNNFRNMDIYKSAQEILGRDLSSTELAQVTPYFGSGSAKELEAGRGVLAQLAEQDKRSPEALNKKYQAQAGQFGGQVGDVFQDLLKRGASQEEVDHFGKMLASGEIDPYSLRQFVTQLPEYRENESNSLATRQAEEDAAARKSLGQELGQYDQEFFNKAKENVLSRYAQSGMGGSTSLDFALTDLMGQIQKERSAYLSDIARRDYESARGAKREDYLGNKGLLREDYNTNLNRMFGGQDYGRDRSAQLYDQSTNRAYGVADYTTQRRDLEELLSRQQSGGRRGGLGGALGSLGGAAIGGMIGGVPGAQIGMNVGQSAGGAYDYLNY